MGREFSIPPSPAHPFSPLCFFPSSPRNLCALRVSALSISEFFSACAPYAATPSSLPLFSSTYNSGNLQPLCFDHVATVGWGGRGSSLFCLFALCLCMPLQTSPFYFQQLARCSSRNPFLSKHLHCCRGMAIPPAAKTLQKNDPQSQNSRSHGGCRMAPQRSVPECTASKEAGLGQR